MKASLCLVLCNNLYASFDAFGSVSIDDKIRLGEELSDKVKPDALQKTPACMLQDQHQFLIRWSLPTP